MQLVSKDKELCRLAAGVRSHGKVELYVDDVKVAEDTGEIQYTDYGISGIPVFQISRYAVKALDEKRNVYAVIDMLPDISDEELEYILDYRTEHEGYKTVEQFLEGAVNKKLVSMACKSCGVDVRQSVSELKKVKLKKLLVSMKHFEVHITDNKGFESDRYVREALTLKVCHPLICSRLRCLVFSLQERCWMLMANVAVITYSGRGVQEGQPLRV